MASPPAYGRALNAEFDCSMGKLGPLLERIEKTDCLIDRSRGFAG
jgi:hypothetical protein